ncbi:MAG: N-acetylneuraminate synthase, partial [Candidatus Marinamargulisbacteria bacterium]
GCDAVKFQKRTIESVYSKEDLDKYRESPWGTSNREQKLGLEFEQAEYQAISDYCNQKDIAWLASAWDLASQEFLRQFDLKYNKIASAMLTDKALLEAVASEGRHTFISTGMSTIQEIDAAVDIFKKANCAFEIMHCNSSYPMKEDQANLKTIGLLKEKYGCPVGYSGHEVGLAISVGAAALGISSLERHITLDRSMYGSDQSSSIEVNGFKKLVDYVRIVELAMGSAEKIVYPEEESAKAKLRKVETTVQG